MTLAASHQAKQVEVREHESPAVSPPHTRLLLLAMDSDWANSLREALRRSGIVIRRLDSPIDALATIAEFDPHVLLIGEYSGDLSIVEFCDAVRTPREHRPFSLILTTRAPLPDAVDVQDLGIDDVLDGELNPLAGAAALVQQGKLVLMSRRVIEREQELLDNLPNALFVVDRELRIWKANRAFMNFLDPGTAKDHRMVIGKFVSALTELPRESLADLAPFVEAVNDAVSSGRQYFRCHIFRDGSESCFAGVLTPLVNSSNRFLVDLSDVTDHERDLLAEARRERLATIGNLALGVAHEIQNPNTFSRVNAANLRELWTILKPALAHEPPRPYESGSTDLARALTMTEAAITGIETASARIAAVLETLKNFGQTKSPIGETDLIDALNEAITLTTHMTRDVCHIACELPASLAPVRASHIELSQVFVNLIENAVNAFEQSQKRVDLARIRIFVSSESETSVVVAVEDNGPGIPPLLQAKIFRPYFTTRSESSGMGLGLSISSEIMQRFGGDLTVTSRLGEGATFLVRLSRMSNQISPLPKEADRGV